MFYYVFSGKKNPGRPLARFSRRPLWLKFLAPTAQNLCNPLIEKHFLRAAFYSAVVQNPLVAAP